MQATPHIDFIATAYAAGVAVIATLVAWVMLDYRLQRRIIAELETKGVSRRSAPSRESAAQMVTTYERVAGSGGATSGPRKLTPGESRLFAP